MSNQTPVAEPGAMFGGYAAAKKRKLPAWAAPVLIGAIAIHLGIFLAMWIKTIWDIERLEKPNIATDLATAAPPPPPPPLPKGGAKPQDVIIPHKRTVRRHRPAGQDREARDQGRRARHRERLRARRHQRRQRRCRRRHRRWCRGCAAAAAAATAAARSSADRRADDARAVAHRGRERHRPRGSHEDRYPTLRQGPRRRVVQAVPQRGRRITSVTQIKSTGFGAYDSKILNTMRTQWKYKPFSVNGKAVPVCTAVTFIYTQT